MKSIPETRAQQAAVSESTEPVEHSAAPGRIDRRQNILDASQRLFARQGYHGVTIRQIAEEAQVPLALVGYYFGQKQELYDAIFGHWSGVIRDRLAGLQAALEPGEGDRLARIVDALVLPSARLRETPEGRSYALLATRGLSQQGQEEDRAIREFFDPLAREFINAMLDAIAAETPSATRAQTAWCYQFALGALLHHLSDQRIERLSDGAAVPADPSVANQLSAFVTAGIRGAMASFAASANTPASEAWGNAE